MGLRLDMQVRLGDFALDAALSVEGGPVAVVGPNGSGKSTLLRAMAGAVQPERGFLQVGERVLVDTAAGRVLPPEERRVGFLPQGYGLFEHLSAEDNVAYGLHALPPETRRSRARALLAELGVESVARRRPRALSGGERQRVALARALATEPELLLLDEPTAALDATVRRETRALLDAHLRAPGRVAVVVTHDLRDLLAWRPLVVLLDAGRVVAVGTVEALRGQDHGPFLRELLDLA